MRTPCTPSREMRTFGAAGRAPARRPSCSSVAGPPARGTRSASDGLRSTTIMRWPSATRGRGPPASPTQLAADCGAFVRAPPEAATRAAAATRATRASAGRLRVRIERKILRVWEGLDEAGGRGDHGRVVGAERQRRERGAGDRGTELRVGRDPADDGDPLRAGRLDSLERPPDQRADDRALVARGEVGAAPLELVGREVANGVEERRLQAGEGEVEARDARNGERVGLRIALVRETVERGAAGVAEAEQPRALVEGLARRVVDGRPDAAEAVPLAHVEEQRVPAAREQAQEGRLERLRLEVERGHVPVQVVDRGEREPAPEGDPLRSRDADEERAAQPRAGRHGDDLDVVEPCGRRAERVADDVRDELQVTPRGDLGYDAAEARVQLRLRGDDVRPDVSGRDDGRRRLVARGLDPEDHHRRRDTSATVAATGTGAARPGGKRVRGACACFVTLGWGAGSAVRRLADRVLPHDQGVLAVVCVVAAPDPAALEAESLVERDRVRVRDAHLEGVAPPSVVGGQLEEPVEERGRDPAPPVRRLHPRGAYLE